jgi:hypothetical protein
MLFTELEFETVGRRRCKRRNRRHASGRHFTDGSGFTVLHREPKTEDQWQADFKRIAERECKTISGLSAELKEEA